MADDAPIMLASLRKGLLVRLQTRWLVGTLAAFSIVFAAGCTKNTGENAGPGDNATQVAQSASFVDNAPGPAAPVAGAKAGGTITVLIIADFEHLDPAQNYMNIQNITAQLIYRNLTMYRETEGGAMEVVGDLATNTGVSADSGRTWTYTLRDGLKYEDGRPVTSRDIAYGIARSFSPALPNGAHFIQQWLADSNDYNHAYKGPYDGGAASPPGVETPDDKTIIFRFKTPHPDFPFAATMANTAPVPRDKDTKVAYDNRPFSSGPYKVHAYQRGQELVLVKNPHWDPNTDPVRHAYPDTIKVKFGASSIQINERLIADQGEDQTTFTWQVVVPEVLPKVLSTPAVLQRVLDGPTQYTRYLAINTQRVTDVNVRRALNWAIDRENFLKVYPPKSAEPGTTILSPALPGYRAYNAYDGGLTGNPEKAKELLGGKTVALTLGFPNTPRYQKVAAFLQSNFEKAGFQITIQPIDPDQYYGTTGKKNNQFDFYFHGWGADWPSGSTVIPPLFDGRQIMAEGNQNTAYLNVPELNARMDALMKEPDITKATDGWGALDRHIMEEYAPVIPLTNERSFSLAGSRVGGLFLSRAFGAASMLNVYVK